MIPQTKKNESDNKYYFVSDYHFISKTVDYKSVWACKKQVGDKLLFL